MEGYLVYCVFVCLSVILFLCIRLRISKRRKKLGEWNFACVISYYPDTSSPLWWTLARGESRGRQNYVGGKPSAAAGIQRQNTYHPPAPAATVGGHWELGPAALLKAVWVLRLASLLTHLLLPAALRAAQICRYLVYSQADFEVFRPAGAIRCTDGGEMWHGGADRRSPPSCQISRPSVQRQGCRTPKIEFFFTQIWPKWGI